MAAPSAEFLRQHQHEHAHQDRHAEYQRGAAPSRVRWRLLLGIRELALRGAGRERLRPARRLLLLLFSSVVTLALNVADPLIAGEWGKAAFDAVGPLLLIGWAEVGPDLLPATKNRYPVNPAIVRAVIARRAAASRDGEAT